MIAIAAVADALCIRVADALSVSAIAAVAVGENITPDDADAVIAIAAGEPKLDRLSSEVPRVSRLLLRASSCSSVGALR